MPAVPPPLTNEGQVIGVTRKQRFARHHTTGEELAGHPVLGSLIFKQVGLVAVAEDMDEQPAAGIEPPGDASQYFRMIPNMFEHLDRHNAIELI